MSGAPPASVAAWQLMSFPDEGDRNDPLIGGMDANPQQDGIPNLLRFPFDPGRDDIACNVEASDDPGDWESAEVLFDSRPDFPERLEGGWLIVGDEVMPQRRFFRLRVTVL